MGEPRHMLSYAPVERPDGRRRLSDAVDAVVGAGCTLFAIGCFVALIRHLTPPPSFGRIRSRRCPASASSWPTARPEATATGVTDGTAAELRPHATCRRPPWARRALSGRRRAGAA
jgi:hypothetical protein